MEAIQQFFKGVMKSSLWGFKFARITIKRQISVSWRSGGNDNYLANKRKYFKVGPYDRNGDDDPPDKPPPPPPASSKARLEEVRRLIFFGAYLIKN